jgi:hypothetical protein
LIGDRLHDLSFSRATHLAIVCFPGGRSGDFAAPIFGLVVFDTFAVSSMEEEAGRPDLAAG